MIQAQPAQHQRVVWFILASHSPVFCGVPLAVRHRVMVLLTFHRHAILHSAAQRSPKVKPAAASNGDNSFASRQDIVKALMQRTSPSSRKRVPANLENARHTQSLLASAAAQNSPKINAAQRSISPASRRNVSFSPVAQVQSSTGQFPAPQLSLSVQRADSESSLNQDSGPLQRATSDDTVSTPAPEALAKGYQMVQPSQMSDADRARYDALWVRFAWNHRLVICSKLTSLCLAAQVASSW